MASHMQTSLTNLVLLVITYMSMCDHASAKEYYIKPIHDTQCPAEPCISLIQFAQEAQYSITSNTTLILLPGNHYLSSNIKISNFTSFTMLGYPTLQFSLEVMSRIICMTPSSLAFENISTLKISNMGMYSCGVNSSNSSAFRISSVLHFDLSNVTFHDSKSLSLKVHGSNGLLRSTQFIGNFGAGLKVTNSSVIFSESNIFLGNLGSGIRVQDSVLKFSGLNEFINNTARKGGGISAKRSTITCSNGVLTFISNFAAWGGGICLENTTLICTGHTKFINNMASQFGGGIFAHSKNTLNISGENIFLNNSAKTSGGGIYEDDHSTIHFNGKSNFVSNMARFGGGIYIYMGSSFNFNGDNSFINNSAEWGGGIYAYSESMVIMNTKSTFANNYAAKHGGGIIVHDGSTVIIRGESSFSGNLAAEFGGGMFLYNNSAVNTSSVINFMNNFAGTSGGGIYADQSTVTINEKSTFVSNTAQYGAGLLAHTNCSVIMNGESSFLDNTAWDGGGFYAMYRSTISVNGTIHFINNIALINSHLFYSTGGGISGWWDSTVDIDGKSMFIGNSADTGGGIYVYNSTVNIRGESHFINNTAEHGGGLYVYNSSYVDISGINTFAYNSAKQHGGGIYTHDYCTVSINGENHFKNNLAHDGGGIYTHTSILSCSGDTIFTGNSALIEGGGISAVQQSIVSLSGESRFTKNRSQMGGAVLVYQSNLTTSGMTSFVANSAFYGGAVHMFIGTVTFRGKGNLVENSAKVNGGALSLEGNSKCYFAFNASFQFHHNSAGQYGGAINVDDTLHRYCTSEQSYQLDIGFIGFDCHSPPPFLNVTSEQDQCIFNIGEPHTAPHPLSLYPPLFHLFFTENSAQAGSVLHGGTIDHRFTNSYLRWHSTEFKIIVPLNSGEMFDTVALIQSDNTTSSISSDPYHICLCFNDTPDCNILTHEVHTYPGQSFLISIVAAGQRNGSVPATIHSYLNDTEARFGEREDTQPTTSKCTELHYTVYSSRKTELITLFAEGPCMDSGGISTSLQLYVTLHDCPTGFMLSNANCICDKRLEKYTNICNIEDQTITRGISEFWVGVDNETGGLILHPHCPFDFCKQDTLTFLLNDKDFLCNYDRSGLLCGGCQPGYSQVFGSSRCLQCSNEYLVLIIAFILAGIILVSLLLALKLTVVVGTINGLIFYANILSVNKSLFFPSGETNTLTVFIAWLNLDLGIETCFFNGMNAYIETWLQFAFPVYLWALVGVIILLSHYSTWLPRYLGSNPVSVLATLFLLSYTKLLRTIITAFSFTYVEYPNYSTAVWLVDGNVEYLKSKHIPLFLTALLTLVFLFLPYTLLLLLGPWIQMHSSKRVFSWISDYRVKTILDAHHAAFKIEHRHWAGIGLVIRCCLFLVFTFNVLGDPSINLLAITCSMLGLAVVLQLIGRIYQKWYLDIIETSFILNLGILATATFFVRERGGYQAALTYTSVGIAFATFCAILVYHAQWQIRESRFWKNTIMPRFQRRQPVLTEDMSESDRHDNEMSDTPIVPPTTTFIDLRELLLEDSN